MLRCRPGVIAGCRNGSSCLGIPNKCIARPGGCSDQRIVISSSPGHVLAKSVLRTLISAIISACGAWSFTGRALSAFMNRHISKVDGVYSCFSIRAGLMFCLRWLQCCNTKFSLSVKQLFFAVFEKRCCTPGENIEMKSEVTRSVI